MKKVLFFVVVILLIVIAGAIWHANSLVESPKAELPKDELTEDTKAKFTDPKNATYIVEGKAVTLVNGIAESPAAPGSTEKTITKYFGNEAVGDLNGDGMADVAFLITQSTGGSGTFYYAVVALKASDGYKGTSAFLLGDRIAPQTTEISGQAFVVNFADRKPGEPMVAKPSVGISKFLRVEGSSVVEILKLF